MQVDEPGSVAHRTAADKHVHVLEKDNGIAYERLTTKVSAGDTGFVFEVDPRFAAAAGAEVVVKVTFLDRGVDVFAVRTATGSTADVERSDSGTWRTATLALPAGSLAARSPAAGATAPRLRVALADGADDLVVRFVRVVRQA